MSAAQGLYAEDVSGTVATDTTWVDVCAISAGSFTASATYLIVANLIGTSTSGANEIRARLVHGTTPTEFTDASLAAEVANLNQQSMVFGWMYVYTQPGTTELVKLQLSSSDTNDVRCEVGQIFALKLGDVGVEDTDWRYNEVTADYTTTSTMTAQAAETFTPNGTDDWLIVGQFAEVPGATNANYRAELHDSVAGVLTSLDIEGEDTAAELRGHVLMRVVTPTNASHTFSIRFNHETTAGTVRSSRLFALNLNKFRQHSMTFDAAEDTPAAAASWTTTRTLAPTPDVTGDWFVWGHYINDNNTLTDSLGTRLQINASGGGLASNPAYGDDMPANNNSWDATDELPMHLFKLLSLASGAARTINLDVQRIAGTTIVVEDRQMVAFSMELPGDSIYTEAGQGDLIGVGSGADTLAVADEGQGTAIGVGSAADTMALTETGGAASAATGSAADVLVLNDAGQADSAATGSAADTMLVEDAGQGLSAASASGADIQVWDEAGQATTTATASGVDALTMTDAAAGVLIGVASGLDDFISGGGGATYDEAGEAVSAFSGGGLDVLVAVEAGDALGNWAASGADTMLMVDVGDGVLVAAGSGLDTTNAPALIEGPYVGDIVRYDLNAAIGSIIGATLLAADAAYDSAGATGTVSGAPTIASDTTYDQAGATGSVTGGTILPPETHQ